MYCVTATGGLLQTDGDRNNPGLYVLYAATEVCYKQLKTGTSLACMYCMQQLGDCYKQLETGRRLASRRLKVSKFGNFSFFFDLPSPNNLNPRGPGKG
ncbi:hypothetical protein PoB_003004700 [Plakobranchus ocellatus]|uniref:Gnk2-homologous domain-containing protein n=1 Tax=Plakobranchus ocellatus TaxID=259542 RepID=A0AAV4A9C0_9GAST|nr:hypothetical protein PoB_003004700 [Plakobranchus ocellatus]